MGEGSHISWTDNTFNYWIGCTKVSAGCDNCYAEREQDLRYGRAKWGKGNARYLTSEANRRKPLQWEKQAIAEGRRIKVFTASLSDVFDEEVSDEWRDGLFEIIRQTPHLDWLVLTKRLAKMLRYVGSLPPGMIPENVWWGCSVEDQSTTNQRIIELLKLRKFVDDAPLWLSIEPLIGPVDLTELQTVNGGRLHALGGTIVFGETDGSCVRPIDWVVVGGESGPAARPMHPDWARSLRDQCVAAGVPFHFKQWGEWTPGENVNRTEGTVTVADWLGGRWFFRDENMRDTDGHRDDEPAVYRVGKKSAGRLLDGRTWDEFPEVRA